MIKAVCNENISAQKNDYLFTAVRSKTQDFLKANGGDVINLGVGDIAYPLPHSITDALAVAAEEMGDNMRFRGYPPEGGYDFLRRAITLDYKTKGVEIAESEVFVGEGSKSDAAALSEIFSGNTFLITSPSYPVYADCAIFGGDKIEYLCVSKENDFLPTPEELPKKPYVIWLCSPQNPTGGAYGVAALKKWVDFALESGSVILFDSAYSAFVDKKPTSIFEIEGARECAVELGSFSKSAGFTGLRCSWVVICDELKIGKTPVMSIYKRRQSSKFNGVSYVVQRGAEAALSKEGKRECAEIIGRYKSNGKRLAEFLKSRGIWFIGGEHSPYVWLECPDKMQSWQFFDRLLSGARVVGTPGCGFGESGEGFFRFSCFCEQEKFLQAIARMDKIFN